MKYRITLLLLVLIVSISCEKKENLDTSFKNEILKFQKSFPLPKKSDSLFPFYAVKFRKIHNDTIFHISRAQTLSNKQYNHYEIFEDEKLNPTVIFDFDNLGKNLIKNYRERKGDQLLKSEPLKSTNPFYLYRLHDNKIIFLKEENYQIQ